MTDALSTDLRALVEGAAEPVTALEAIDRPRGEQAPMSAEPPSRNGRQRRPLIARAAAIVVVALLGAGAVVVAATRDDEDRPAEVETAGQRQLAKAVGTWSEVPTADDLSFAQPPIGVATSDAAYLVGPGQDGTVTGWAYDPSTGGWSPLPDTQSTWSAGTQAIAAGERLVVYLGTPSGDQPSILRYDPAAQRWDALPEPPGGARSGASIVWTGEQLVLWGGFVGGSPTNIGYALDDGGSAWQELAAAPLAARGNHVAVWAGDRMIVWGGCAVDEPPGQCADIADGTDLVDGASWTPATGQWASLPEAPTGPRAAPRVAWDGESVILWGGFLTGDDPVGLAYSTSSNTWQALPDGPVSGTGEPVVTAVGDQVLVLGGTPSDAATRWEQTATEAALLDVQTGSWRPIAESPLSPRLYPAVAPIPDTSQVLVWGGLTDPTSGTLAQDGALLSL
ncbi:MAG: Kelch repeat-containing protein [Acidimicrobiales bacterium]